MSTSMLNFNFNVKYQHSMIVIDVMCCPISVILSLIKREDQTGTLYDICTPRYPSTLME